MDIFTDASLNDSEKVAGIGCVCINDSKEKMYESTFSLSTNNIHIAELCALACAVKLASTSQSESVRIVSDSVSALNTLYQYIGYSRHFPRLTDAQKKFFHKVDRSQKQKIILEEMVSVFMQSPIHFSFVHTSGHQNTQK